MVNPIIHLTHQTPACQDTPFRELTHQTPAHIFHPPILTRPPCARRDVRFAHVLNPSIASQSFTQDTPFREQGRRELSVTKDIRPKTPAGRDARQRDGVRRRVGTGKDASRHVQGGRVGMGKDASRRVQGGRVRSSSFSPSPSRWFRRPPSGDHQSHRSAVVSDSGERVGW